MFKTALNKNIIPHTWRLANIVPNPKPNKDTSYRPISLLSVSAKTLEKSLLPYITANIPKTPMQHGYKTQVTALHTLNYTGAKGFIQMAPPARTDTLNIHTIIRKLLQTNIPGTIIKFIADNNKGRDAYTTYRNHTSSQRQFKTGIPQGGILSPTLFNIYTYHHTVHQFRSWPMQTTSPSHPQARVQSRNTYKKSYIKFLPGQNNLILNLDKATYTLFTPDPAEYTSNLDLGAERSIANCHRILLVVSLHQTDPLLNATGCKQDTNIQHLHDKTLTLPIHEHLQLHASQYKQKTQHPLH